MPKPSQTVFVTGASAGFGAEIVRRFAAAGARVVATARRAERLKTLAAECGADKILPLALDVQDRPAVERAIAGLPEPFAAVRSEEHTSELQSRRDLVCRLLLEKK